MELVVIETASHDDASAIAAELPGSPRVRAGHGYAMIAMRMRTARDAKTRILPLVRECVERHRISWARVRIGDDNHQFRG